MKRVLASYRWRRRLAWTAVAALVVGSAVAVGLIWSNTGHSEQAAPTGGPIRLDYRPPKAVRLKHRDRTEALQVAAKFIDSAVARKNVDRSWSLAAPELRQGITRAEWDRNENSIVPFPVAEARWKLQFSDVRGIGFTMALFPKNGSEEKAQVFMIGLHKVGAGKNHRWLVDNWQPAPTSGANGGGASGALTQAGPQLGTPTTVGGKSKESPFWLLLPIGLLSLVIVIPAIVGATGWYRGRRALREAGY